jgi:hypothetical protein
MSKAGGEKKEGRHSLLATPDAPSGHGQTLLQQSCDVFFILGVQHFTSRWRHTPHPHRDASQTA